MDVDGSGGVSCNELLNYFAVDQTRAFAQRIFSLLAGEEDADVEFIEFVVCVWNLCTLTSDSVGRFLFELYDDDESGEIEFEELAVMMADMMGRRTDSRSKAANVKIEAHIQTEVEKMLDVIRKNSKQVIEGDHLTREGFSQMIQYHLDLFAPAFDIQRVLREKIIGLQFWREQIKLRNDNNAHHLMKKLPRVLSDIRERGRVAKIARHVFIETWQHKRRGLLGGGGAFLYHRFNWRKKRAQVNPRGR
eukprot:FR741372.1.p1 GENE.FR741372.1~~FR741372.1.p1  ORF type:complete len:260 (+),score=52.30 FR741372.1:38-781(+)